MSTDDDIATVDELKALHPGSALSTAGGRVWTKVGSNGWVTVLGQDRTSRIRESNWFRGRTVPTGERIYDKEPIILFEAEEGQFYGDARS